MSEERIVDRVAVRVRELESQLLEEEIAAFEEEIDRLRDWLARQTEEAR